MIVSSVSSRLSNTNTNIPQRSQETSFGNTTSTISRASQRVLPAFALLGTLLVLPVVAGCDNTGEGDPPIVDAGDDDATTSTSPSLNDTLIESLEILGATGDTSSSAEARPNPTNTSTKKVTGWEYVEGGHLYKCELDEGANNTSTTSTYNCNDLGDADNQGNTYEPKPYVTILWSDSQNAKSYYSESIYEDNIYTERFTPQSESKNVLQEMIATDSSTGDMTLDENGNPRVKATATQQKEKYNGQDAVTLSSDGTGANQVYYIDGEFDNAIQLTPFVGENIVDVNWLYENGDIANADFGIQYPDAVNTNLVHWNTTPGCDGSASKCTKNDFASFDYSSITMVK